MISFPFAHAVVAFALSATAWAILQTLATQRTGPHLLQGPLLSSWALLVGLCVAGSRWATHVSNYSDDTYFSLSVAGRIALTILSLALIFLICAMARLFGQWICRQIQFARLLRLVFAFTIIIASFWIALTLAPQVYYLLYLTLFDQLPVQWVIRPVGILELASQISFRSTPTFASTLIGASFWASIASTALAWFHCHITETGVKIPSWKFAIAVALAVLCTNLLLQIG